MNPTIEIVAAKEKDIARIFQILGVKEENLMKSSIAQYVKVNNFESKSKF